MLILACWNLNFGVINLTFNINLIDIVMENDKAENRT